MGRSHTLFNRHQAMSTVFQSLCFNLENRRPYTPHAGFSGQPSHEAVQYAQSGTLVHMTGRTLGGSNVHVCVYGCRPTFYVRVCYKASSGSGVRETLTKLHLDDEYAPWMIHSEERVKRRIYQGFKNGEEDELWRVTAANVSAQRKVVSVLEAANKAARDSQVGEKGGGDGEEDGWVSYFPHFELFNTRVDPTCAFLHAAQIKPGGWVRISAHVPPDLVDKYPASKCAIDMLVNFAIPKSLSAVEPEDAEYTKYASAIAPFKIMSFDIEAISQFDEESGRYPFPDADLRLNAISCICARVYTYGRDGVNAVAGGPGGGTGRAQYEDVAFTYRPCNAATVAEICAREGVDALAPETGVRSFTSERDMLRAFVLFFKQRGIGVLTGWNIMGFDLAYLYKRCKRHGVDVADMSKFSTTAAPKLRTKVLDTAAAGHNEMVYFTMEGVLLLDELVNVRRDVSLKLSSYRLDAVAEHYFSDHKVDMAPSEIHRMSQLGPDELAEVVGYCCKDAKLPMDIVNRRQSFLKTLMFAKLCLVPPSYVIERGAIVKSYSAIANAVHLKGWVVCDMPKSYNTLRGKYAGATVLDAKAGLYKTPIAGLDFASLYPSVMVSQFLDPQTFVEDEQYLGCEGVTYKWFNWHDDSRSYSYAIATSGEALIPDLLLALWAARKEAKKRIKQAETSAERAVHDASQMAIKVLMNSIYGAFGAVKTNGLAHLPIAMLTTYNGRCMIEEARRYTLARYGTYSDGSTFEDRIATKTFAQLDEACEGGVDVVYGDTDSIMVQWQVPKEFDERASLEHVFRLAKEAADEITAHLNDTMCARKGVVELEFEKVMFWYVLYSKKRYASFVIEDIDKPGKFDAKGIQIVRRDIVPFVRALLKDALYTVLRDHSVEDAARLVEERLRAFADGHVDLAQLTLTGSGRAPKKSLNVSAPMAVARKLRERGLEVPDRVAYVFVIAQKGAKQEARGECPKWAAEHGMPIDLLYYFDHQLLKPIIDVLGAVLPDTCSSASSPLLADIRTRLTQRQKLPQVAANAASKRQRLLTDMMRPAGGA
eukprot:6211202-Pleurochrysis_carterae.AAC.5